MEIFSVSSVHEERSHTQVDGTESNCRDQPPGSSLLNSIDQLQDQVKPTWNDQNIPVHSSSPANPNIDTATVN
jgi:hypothetical protein